MTDLKLSKLPDRTPVKLSILLSPRLHADLVCYLDLYHAAYDDKMVTAVDLIPAMLESFLDGDRAFRSERRRKEKGDG